MEQKFPFLHTLFRERKAHSIEKIDSLVHTFSISEKVIFLLFLAVFAGATLSLLGKISDAFSSHIPRHGGTLIEGIIGTPRFINPLLAVSDADRDLSQLVYSGLLKTMPDGTIVPNLAESYSISPDGLVYTLTLRADARFHDGTAVTYEDVEYTVHKAQDPALKSPRRVNWEGVSIEKSGDRDVVFKLKQPYAPFIYNLSLGILPAHVWKNLTIDQIPFSSLNTAPIGSGPYKIISTKKSADGIPTEINLRAFSQHVLGEPYITHIVIKPFANEQLLVSALKEKQIDSASNLSPMSAHEIEQAHRIISAPFTRIFGIFFNQSQNEFLAHKEIRQLLSASIDKDSLINTLFGGYGTVIDGPLPPTITEKISASSSALEASTTRALATKALVKAGWKKNEAGIYEMKPKTKGAATTTLALSLSTANIPDLIMAAKKINEAWDAAGAKTEIRVFEPSDLNQSIIRPRRYDALLFGLVIGRNSDLYPFWHSSQRNDPGLNIALYTNKKADQFLEKMRTATSTTAIASLYNGLAKEIHTDIPALFLWSPDFLYAVPPTLGGVNLGEITTSSDRFLGVEKWYVEQDHVWNIFVKDQNSIINQ